MKLLLTGAFNWTDEHIKELEKVGCEILFTEREDADIPFDVSNIDAVICNWLFVHHDITKFTNLKYIQLLSAGLDRVPLAYIKEKKIALSCARGVYSIPMAEFAVCGVLQLYKNSCFFQRNQQEGVWQKNRDLLELAGKHVCIIGAGSVGTEVAKRFSAFTEEVYGIDLLPGENAYMKAVYSLEKLEKELNISDVVILTLPLTDLTRNMFSTERFKQMKEGAVFVNISRGGLVDENAFAKALDERLYGGVSDVFQEEPLPRDSVLWEKKNLIITPHNSFVSEKNDERMWKVIWNNLLRYKEDGQ